jgi:hypothetical protein
MASLKGWLDRLLGRTPEPQEPVARPPQARKARPKPAQPGGLEIVDAPPAEQPKHPGAAGFDPYGNDAGYTKPHSWERIDHD